MVSPKLVSVGFLILLIHAATAQVRIPEADCTTVTGLLSACTAFISYGSPDPQPGSACCDAMKSLGVISESSDKRQLVCRCLMGIITNYNPNANAVATLPGFCGISLGFIIGPITDCTYV